MAEKAGKTIAGTKGVSWAMEEGKTLLREWRVRKSL